MMSVEIGVQHMNGLSSMYGMNGQCGMSIYICTEHGDHSTHAIISYVTSLYSRQFVLNPFAKLSNTHTQRMALLKWHYNFADDPARTKLNCGHYECCLNKLQTRIYKDESRAWTWTWTFSIASPRQTSLWYRKQSKNLKLSFIPIADNTIISE